MITTKRPNTDDYTQIGFIEAKDDQGNYQNIDHIYDNQGSIIFQQGYLNEYDGADDFGIPAIGKPLIDYAIYGNAFQDGIPTSDDPIMPEGTGDRTAQYIQYPYSSGSMEVDGITWTMHTDGRLTGEGTTTRGTNYYIANRKSLPLKAGTYTISWQGDKNLNLILRNVTKSETITNIGGSNKSTTFTIAEDIPETDLISLYFNTSESGKTVSIDGYPMLNLGSTALSYEPYGYKLDISSGGVNLFDKDATDTNNGYMNSKYIGYDGNIGNSANHNISEYIAIPVGAKHLTISNVSESAIVYCQFYDSNKNAISIFRYDTIPRTVSIPSNAKYIRCSISKVQMSNFMLNTGSLALPYEPYVAPTVKSIYLGEVQTTRKTRKLVLTGKENVAYNSRNDSRGRYVVTVPANDGTTIPENVICTHFKTVNTTIAPLTEGGICMRSTGNDVVIGGLYDDIGVTSPADALTIVTAFKSYLAQQYTNGTPITIWYVLETPETTVVNEPLMRIDDYVDSVNFSQAGVEIPTLKRPNTTVIDITTSLPPSEVYAKYRGSKTQKYDLFLAANGDSFEAKNGQSLYI